MTESIAAQFMKLGNFMQMAGGAGMQMRAPFITSGCLPFGGSIYCGGDAMGSALVEEWGRRNALQAMLTNAANNPVNPNATPQGNTQLKSTNPAECFKKLNNATLKKLQDLEKSIKEAQTKFEEAKRTNNKEQKSAIAKRLNALKAEYTKLERTISSSSVSKKYGKEFNFYTNISEYELESIKSSNQSIEQTKKDLQRLERELEQQKMAIMQKMQQLQATGRNPNEVPQELKDKALAKEQEINELRQQLSDQITELDNYVRKAGESTEDVDPEVAKAERGIDEAGKAEQAKRKQEAQGKEKIAQIIAGSIYKDGKVNDRNTILKALEGLKEYKQADKEAVVDFLLEKAKEKGKEEEFNKYLTSKEFYTDTQTKFSADDYRLILLEKVYDQKFGKKGAFRANFVSNYDKDKTGLKPLKTALVNTTIMDNDIMTSTLELLKNNKKNKSLQSMVTEILEGIVKQSGKWNKKDNETELKTLKATLENYKDLAKINEGGITEDLYKDAIAKIDAILAGKQNPASVPTSAPAGTSTPGAGNNNGNPTPAPANGAPSNTSSTNANSLITKHTKDGKIDYKGLLNDIEQMQNTQEALTYLEKIGSNIPENQKDYFKKVLLKVQTALINDEEVNQARNELAENLTNDKSEETIARMSDAMILKLVAEKNIGDLLYNGTNSEHKNAFVALTKRIDEIARYTKNGRIYIENGVCGYYANTKKNGLPVSAESNENIYKSVTSYYGGNCFKVVEDLAKEILKKQQ